MSLIGQLFGDSSNSSTDALNGYFQNRMNQDFNRIGLNANTQSQTTTIPSAPAIPQAPVEAQPQASAPTAPVAPPAITPTPAANQILSQPPGQPVMPSQAPAMVPPPGQAQLMPTMNQTQMVPPPGQAQIQPPMPTALPPTGQAQLAQTPAPQLAQPVAPQQPLIAGNVSSDVGQTPTEQAVNQLPTSVNTPQLHEQNLVNWQDDPRKIQLIANDPRTPEEGGPPAHVKQMANKKMLEYYNDTANKNAATNEANRLVDNNDTKGIARIMQKNEPEGSYLKAYLYHRLGLSQLAQQEQAKLGAGATTQRITMPDGTQAIVRLRADGVASYGVDTKSGQELTPDQLALASAGYAKGTETGKTMYKTRDGHVITMSTVPGRIEPVYYDNTAKTILPNAPLGLTPLGQKDSIIEAGMASKKQVETAARKDNNKAGGTLYTEQQIQDLGNHAFRSIVGYDYNAREHGIVSPYEEARQGEPGAPGQAQINQKAPGQTVSGQGEFADPSIHVISAYRPTQQQQDMWDESVAAGRPGVTAQGNPIAKPGTSMHEADNARDIDAAKLTKAGRQELYQKGWYQPIPQTDPNHWERIGAPPAKEEPTAPSGVRNNIESQAQAIANYQSKPATAGGQQGPYNQAVMARVRQINPEYDESKWETAKKTRQAFTTGRQGDTVRNLNVSVGHLDTLNEAARALDNNNFRLANQVTNEYRYAIGAPEITNFNALKTIVGNEVAKAVSGAGGSALGDREEIRREIDAANSPKQLVGVVKKYQDLMAEQLVGLKTQYEDSGLKDFNKKVTPRTKEVLGRIIEEKKNTRSSW